jgi:hypothetical protein
VYLPEDTPIEEVYPYSVPDWAPEITMRKLDRPLEATPGVRAAEVASQITWSAVEGAATKPGQVAELSISINPVPRADHLVFTVVQTYADGTVVRWSDKPPGEGHSGQHRAPVLTIRAPSDQAPDPAAATPPAAQGQSHQQASGDYPAGATSLASSPAPVALSALRLSGLSRGGRSVSDLSTICNS